MSVATFTPSRPALSLSLRFAVRGLRGGLSGFGVFIACLAIGVAAIVAVSTLSNGLIAGLAREGRSILGGDAAFALIQREARFDERDWFASQGKLGTVALLRAMSRVPSGAAALVELKAVDDTYPMQGQLEFDASGPFKGLSVADLIATRSGLAGAIVDPVLAERLDLKPGDSFTVGNVTLQYRASLTSEPDKLAGGLSLGPRVLISQKALAASGLIQPGSLVRWVYRVLLPDGQSDDAATQRLLDETAKRFPNSGFEVRSRSNAAPQLTRNLERFTQFLTLVGLTSLLVGGVGIANATRAYVERKRVSIAALKSLGATGSFVFSVCLAEVMALALVGIALGLVIGSIIPPVVAGFGKALLPFPLVVGFDAKACLLGIVYGLLTAFAFAVWPLGKAHDIPVSTLFRDEAEDGESWPRRSYMIAVALGALLLIAAAVAFAADRRIALIYVGIAFASFLLLRLVGQGIMRAAARVPHSRKVALRLAIANIHKPGALTPSVVLSLGLGLTLLVALTLIEGSIRGQLTQGLPEKAPSFFFLDIPREATTDFSRFVSDRAPGGKLAAQPMMRGRITALNGVPVAKIQADEKVAWVLDGDRGITYDGNVPPGSRVSEGEWWPKDYSGPPLLSFGDELAKGLGLKVGDSVTVNVFGRQITAKIANLRAIDWQSLGINFVMVFSPNTFRGAPHTDLATLTFETPVSAAEEGNLVKSVAAQFPAISVVRVKDTLDAISELVGQLSLALRLASAVALLSSALVLAGALAAGQRARIHDAVILKTLGATRLRLLSAFLLEYGVLGLITAAFGALAGAVAAYLITVSVMHLPFSFSLSGVVFSTIFALILTIGIGLAQTLRILGQKPAPYLRNL